MLALCIGGHQKWFLYKAKKQGAHLTVYLLQNNVDDAWLWAKKAGLGGQIWVVDSEWLGLGWERRSLFEAAYQH